MSDGRTSHKAEAPVIFYKTKAEWDALERERNHMLTVLRFVAGHQTHPPDCTCAELLEEWRS